MEFNLKNIVDFISTITGKEPGIKVGQNVINHNFRLSSIKSIIKNGLYFLTKDYMEEASQIHESVILTDSDETPQNNNTYIIVDNPQLIHYKLSSTLEEKRKTGIHPTAIIDPDANIDSTAYIGPFCIIGKSVIERDVILQSHVIVANQVTIKTGTVIEGNSYIGARGMAWIWDEQGNRIMQPQVGGVIIEENCLLGTDITIVRGSLSENTIIGAETVIAHGSKIGHGSQVGKHVHFANNVSLAGNSVIGNRTFLGSASVVSSNVIIPAGCIVGAGAVVNKSFDEENITLAGVPAKIITKHNFENKPTGAPKPFKN